MSKKSAHTPNDHRSIIKNPNNPAYHHNNGNRGGQMNPQHPNYQGEPPATGGSKTTNGDKK